MDELKKILNDAGDKVNAVWSEAHTMQETETINKEYYEKIKQSANDIQEIISEQLERME